MEDESFEKSYTYFVENQQRLAQTHYGKFVVIHDGEVKDFFDKEIEAFLSAKEKFAANSNIIRKCIRPEEEEKIVFHSQVL